MPEFVTITMAHGVTIRPIKEGDVAGERAKKDGGGTLEIHANREAACARADAFWVNKGFKSDMAHYQ